MFVFGFISFCCLVVFRSVLVIVVAVRGFAGCVLMLVVYCCVVGLCSGEVGVWRLICYIGFSAWVCRRVSFAALLLCWLRFGGGTVLFWWLSCRLGCHDLRVTLCLRVCVCWFASDYVAHG